MCSLTWVWTVADFIATWYLCSPFFQTALLTAENWPLLDRDCTLCRVRSVCTMNTFFFGGGGGGGGGGGVVKMKQQVVHQKALKLTVCHASNMPSNTSNMPSNTPNMPSNTPNMPSNTSNMPSYAHNRIDHNSYSLHIQHRIRCETLKQMDQM